VIRSPGTADEAGAPLRATGTLPRLEHTLQQAPGFFSTVTATGVLSTRAVEAYRLHLNQLKFLASCGHAKLWDAVQRRRAAKERKSTPQARTAHAPSPVSTLFYCGVCGHWMSIAGRSHGSRAFGYSARSSKGPTACPNAHTIQEGKLLKFFGEKLAAGLAEIDGAFEKFEASVQRQLAARRRPSAPRTAALDAAIRKAEALVGRTADTLLAVGVSDVLRARLADAERALARLRAERAASEAPAPVRPMRLPSPAALRALWGDVGALLSATPHLARERLGQHFDRITLTPRETKKAVVYTLTTALRMPDAEQVSCGGGI
jgi:hypothetical protein